MKEPTFIRQRRTTLARMSELMARSRTLRRNRVTATGLSAGARALAEWQAQRLAHTYADFQRQPRYRLAVEFFLRDLYGPLDFTQRDADIERVYPVMARVLSGHALESITQALELHTLSQEFDARMVEILADLGAVERIDAHAYAEAFRRCGDREGRLRQVELVEQVGRTLDDVVHHPVIYATVLAARVPAKLAGFGELQDFIERGVQAFRRMNGAEEFIAAIGERERSNLEQIFAGEDGDVPDLRG